MSAERVTTWEPVGVELDRAESDAVLEGLFAILYAPYAVLVHEWTPGDLVIWDSRAIQHGRPSLRTVTARHLQRMSVSDVSGVHMPPAYLMGLPARLGAGN